MEIKLQELKKVFTSPIVIILIVIFSMFNLFNIYKNSYIRDDLKVINTIIDEFGYKIDDNMIEKMKSRYKVDMKELNKITEQKIGKKFSNIDEFIESREYQYSLYEGKKFTEAEMIFFKRVNLINVYSKLSMEQINDYESLNMKELGKGEIKGYKLTKKAKKIAEKRYEEVDKILDNIKENKEHKNMFFIGKTYRLHSLLFKEIFSNCIYQIMILSVLISSYLVNYEFDNKTSLIVYSTKRGRNNSKDKLIVSLVSTIITTVIILGTSLIGYFSVFDYSRVWKVPINTVFNWELNIPYINIRSNTIIEQLILSVFIVLICMLIFSLITFVISKLIKNNYLVFFIFFIVFGFNLMLPIVIGGITNSSAITMYLNCDVFNLIISPSNWFMAKVPFIQNNNYELVTIMSWIIITVIGSVLAIKKFKREDFD